MGLCIIEEDGLLVPKIICDFCKKPIARTNDGWVYWLADENSRSTEMVFTHSKGCGLEGLFKMDISNGRYWLNRDLNSFVRQLQHPRNLIVDPAIDD